MNQKTLGKGHAAVFVPHGTYELVYFLSELGIVGIHVRLSIAYGPETIHMALTEQVTALHDFLYCLFKADWFPYLEHLGPGTVFRLEYLHGMGPDQS